MNTRFRNIATAVGLAAASLHVAAQDCKPLDPSTPVPAPLEEAMPLQPASEYVWSPGYWSWQCEGYDWVGGEWILPGYDAVPRIAVRGVRLRPRVPHDVAHVGQEVGKH
jgi:hypothetical protein